MEADSDWFKLVQLQQRLGGTSGPDCVFGEGGGVPCEGVDEWAEAVLSLSLAASCLAESDLTRRTQLVSVHCIMGYLRGKKFVRRNLVYSMVTIFT